MYQSDRRIRVLSTRTPRVYRPQFYTQNPGLAAWFQQEVKKGPVIRGDIGRIGNLPSMSLRLYFMYNRLQEAICSSREHHEPWSKYPVAQTRLTPNLTVISRQPGNLETACGFVTNQWGNISQLWLRPEKDIVTDLRNWGEVVTYVKTPQDIFGTMLNAMVAQIELAAYDAQFNQEKLALCNHLMGLLDQHFPAE